MTNPIKYSDLVSPDNSIRDLIAQLDELSDAYTNALKNIKAEAIQLAAILKTVSGSTEAGRRVTQSAASDADRLAKAYHELEFASSQTAKEVANLRIATAEQNQINKLVIKINKSAEGSYNRLSAQYSLNKIYINNMTVAEREATEEGRKLVKETAAIYEEMKRLQEATGKHQLNVGNYPNLRKEMNETTQSLAAMRMAGQENTEEYQRLLEKAGQMKDALTDANAAVKNMASDTAKFDSVLSGLTLAGGGFSAVTGAMALFGKSGEDVQEIQKKLQATMAITNGLTAVQNALQSQSALMLGISALKQAALTKAKVYDRLITIQGTKATTGAIVAQKAFNLVASANPYVLLAIALVTVVGALVAFSAGADKSAKNQQKLNDAQKAWLDLLESEASTLRDSSNERVSKLQRELDIAKSRNASLKETRDLEDKIFRERTEASYDNQQIYAEELANLEANRKQLAALQKQLYDLNAAKAAGKGMIRIDIDEDGMTERVKVDEAIDTIQGKVDNLGRKIQIATELKTEQADLIAEYRILENRRLQEDEATAKQERDIIRKSEDAKIALYKNTYDQQRALARARTNREIFDIEYMLTHEANLTEAARKALNEQIVSLRAQLAKELRGIDAQAAATERAFMRAAEDSRIAAMKEGAEKQREELRVQYERQIEDLQTRLDTEEDLTLNQERLLQEQQANLRAQYAERVSRLDDEIAAEQLNKEIARTQLRLDATREGAEEEMNLRLQLLQQQRELELTENRKLAEDVRQSEADINAKYDAEVLKLTDKMTQERELLILDRQQELEASEFDLLRNSEERKTRFRLEQERERLKKILELNRDAGIKLSDMEVQTIQNTIKRIDNEIKASKGKERSQDLYGLFGLNLDDEQKKGIDTSVEYAMDALNEYMERMMAAAEAKKELADRDVERAQSTLEAEIEARNAGYANNVVMAQKELENAKRNQEKALAEQRKAQKAQEAIQAVQQIGNLVLATSLIWSQLGFPWALPAIGVMWTSYAASKIKAIQVAKQSEAYGEGTVELLQGGSHQSGNDIDLGTKPDGTRRRAEGGEFFAVINKRNSRRFRAHIPAVIKSLNDGTFAHKYLNAYKGGEAIAFNVQGATPDLRELSADVREIKEQNRRRTYIDGDGNVIERYKNLTRKVRRG